MKKSTASEKFISIKGDESVEELIAKVDEGENLAKVSGGQVIIMIRMTTGLIKPEVYNQFIKRLKTIRPNLYSKYLEELGVDDFSVSFKNRFKKLLPAKTQNKLLFFLFFPFKFTWMAFAGLAGDPDDSDGRKMADVVISIIWMVVMGIIANLTS
jgi:hypothetical protein